MQRSLKVLCANVFAFSLCLGMLPDDIHDERWGWVVVSVITMLWAALIVRAEYRRLRSTLKQVDHIAERWKVTL